MSDWYEAKIKDFADVKGGKRLPKGKQLVKEPNNHPYIRIRDLGKSKYLQLTSEYEYVDDETQQSISRYIVNKGDILISVVGTIGLIGIVGATLDGANQTENCDKIINITGVMPEYLYYYLKSNLGQDEIRKGTVGAVQPKLPLKNVQDISVFYPPMEEQERIVAILSAIDEKIETNEAVNNNLEQQAMALFKSWFIDYEPFGGQLPTIWKSGVLGDFVEIKRGGSPRPIQNFLSDSGLHWLKISDATCISSPFINEIKEYIIEDGLKKTVFLKAGNLVLSNSATPGLPKILDIDTCIHDGWLYFPSSKFSNEYLYLYFRHIRDNLVALGNGSVFTNLKTDILKNYPTNLPTGDVLSKFDEVIKPMFSMILSKTRESKRLMEIRDSLLPKLMSGELDVSDIDL